MNTGADTASAMPASSPHAWVITGPRRSSRDGAGRLEDMSLEDVECFLIKKAMTRFDGNVSQAAKALGLSRSALYRRLQRYGL